MAPTYSLRTAASGLKVGLKSSRLTLPPLTPSIPPPMRLNPFRALRPPPEFAAQVACVPYDVVNREEAAALAPGTRAASCTSAAPTSICPPSTDPYDARVYAQARAALEGFLRDGTLLRDADRRCTSTGR